MQTKIIHSALQLTVYGFGGLIENNNPAGTAFRLSGKMWELVKKNDIKNKGKNIWVYDEANTVFAGVELENESVNTETGLEKKQIQLARYACFIHTGPYQLIKQAGQKMRDELMQQGYRIRLPYIEIYGHWTGDENKTETTLLMNLV